MPRIRRKLPTPLSPPKQSFDRDEDKSTNNSHRQRRSIVIFCLALMWCPLNGLRNNARAHTQPQNNHTLCPAHLGEQIEQHRTKQNKTETKQRDRQQGSGPRLRRARPGFSKFLIDKRSASFQTRSPGNRPRPKQRSRSLYTDSLRRRGAQRGPEAAEQCRLQPIESRLGAQHVRP